MRAHEAGALHADGYAGPSWLRPPADVNALVPGLWARTVRRAEDGALSIGGCSVRDLANQHGTPAYLIDEFD
ncbi:MAG: diaminopimelate decarboxylase, partial [Angustibacter sp.]